jgi:hypothetical protein
MLSTDYTHPVYAHPETGQPFISVVGTEAAQEKRHD